MIDALLDPGMWASLLTLSALEIVLGIDNLVFLSIVTERLPAHQQPKARTIGLAGAFVMRVILLSAVVWLASLTAPVFTILEHSVSWRDLILLSGGLFLLIKGTMEIHEEVEGEEAAGPDPTKSAKALFMVSIAQIMVLDIVFSFDSVITAVGMTNDLPVMIAAVTISIIIMMFAAGTVSAFIQKHPTTKMLALSFLLLIGMALIADSLHFHIPRAYLYFAIAFSLMVEVLNIVTKSRREKKKTEG